MDLQNESQPVIKSTQSFTKYRAQTLEAQVKHLCITLETSMELMLPCISVVEAFVPLIHSSFQGLPFSDCFAAG
jgi:hypothetical protein